MSLRVSLAEYKQTYEAYFMKYIEDKAAAVRQEGVKWLGKIASTFPRSYVYEELIPKLN